MDKSAPLLVAALALVLSGCVSYSQMQAKPPMITATSAKSPDEVVGCIAPRWADLAQVSVFPDGDAQIVNATGAGPGQVLYQISVRPQGEGSHIEYRQMTNRTGAGYGIAQSAVEACR